MGCDIIMMGILQIMRSKGRWTFFCYLHSLPHCIGFGVGMYVGLVVLISDCCWLLTNWFHFNRCRWQRKKKRQKEACRQQPASSHLVDMHIYFFSTSFILCVHLWNGEVCTLLHTPLNYPSILDKILHTDSDPPPSFIFSEEKKIRLCGCQTWCGGMLHSI